ncbi:hypothetical protein IKE67_05740 [bacterium]|nr:hypothetical protein [bacterium]
MKNFIVRYCGFFINVAALITIIGLIISTVKVTFYQGFMAGVSVFWAGIVSFIFVYFLIYLVMSINDNLADLNEKLDNKY